MDLDDTFIAKETLASRVGEPRADRLHAHPVRLGAGVVFEVDGSPLTNFGGYEIDGAQRRANFADQLPFILVQTPRIGERVSSPVHIAGLLTCSRPSSRSRSSTSTVTGDRSTFTMATCGTGCRGTWDHRCRVRRRRDPARHDPRVRGQRDGRFGDRRGEHPGHADCLTLWCGGHDHRRGTSRVRASG